MVGGSNSIKESNYCHSHVVHIIESNPQDITYISSSYLTTLEVAGGSNSTIVLEFLFCAHVAHLIESKLGRNWYPALPSYRHRHICRSGNILPAYKFYKYSFPSKMWYTQ